MSTDQLRPTLARDGIFNARDLGGIPSRSGHVVARSRVVRADALQRAQGSAGSLRRYGISRVLDLRDEREREHSGVLVADGIEVLHHPVVDPAFAWHTEADAEVAELLVVRYRDILEEFGPRLAGALASIDEVVAAPAAEGRAGAVAFHCAVGKDRTGILAALLLSLLDVDPQVIAQDYARSSAATAVQVQWLWSFGMPGGDATDEDMSLGVWSARPQTMLTTLAWIDAEYGGVETYLAAQGLAASVPGSLRSALLVPADGAR